MQMPMDESRRFYRVVSDLYDVRLPDPLSYGFETERDFRHALWRLVDRWKRRAGEVVDERHDHLLIRFYDTPGGRPDEAWLPMCLLEPAEAPPDDGDGDEDGIEEEIDSAFGFD